MIIGFTEAVLLFILAGIILLMLAMAIIVHRSRGDLGGVVLIGPIPIIFGNSKFLRRYWWMLALMGVAILALYLLPILIVTIAV